MAAQAARVVLLSYLAAACSVSHYQSGASLATLDGAPIPHARVHLVDGTTVLELRDVTVVTDSVMGISGETGARVAIPVASVASVEAHSVSTGRTVALIVGIVAGTALVLFAWLVYMVTHSNADF